MEAARNSASGPSFANGITKNQLNMEWDMSLDTAIEAEAQAQAICMQTKDFERAYASVRRQAEACVRGRLMMITHNLCQPRAGRAPKGYANGIAGSRRALVFHRRRLGWDAQQTLFDALHRTSPANSVKRC